MGLLDTTQEKVTEGFLRDARKCLSSLKRYIEEVEYELDRHLERNPGGVFDVNWVHMLNEKLFSFHNEIARANGACIVRGTTPEETK